MTHKERAKRRGEMAQLVSAGVSLAEVAHLYSVTEATVRNACAEYGQHTRYNRRIPYSAIADMLNTEDTLTAIAERHKLPANYAAKIYRRCVAAGMKMAKRRPGAPKRCK